jgi:hypothetical protein
VTSQQANPEVFQRRLKASFDPGEILYKVPHPRGHPTRKRASSLAAALCGSSIRKEGIVLQIAQLEIIWCWWIVIVTLHLSKKEATEGHKEMLLVIHEQEGANV